MTNQTKCLAYYALAEVMQMVKKDADSLWSSFNHGTFELSKFFDGTLFTNLWKPDTLHNEKLTMETQSGVKQTESQRMNFKKLANNLFKKWFYDPTKDIPESPRVNPELFIAPSRWGDDPSISEWFGLILNAWGYRTDMMNVADENEWNRHNMSWENFLSKVNKTANDQYDDMGSNLVSSKLGLNQYVNLNEIATLGCWTKVTSKSLINKVLHTLITMAQERDDQDELITLQALQSSPSIAQLVKASKLLVAFSEQEMIESSLLDYPASWYKQQEMVKQRQKKTTNTETPIEKKKSQSKYDADSDDDEYTSTLLSHSIQHMNLVENKSRDPFVTPLMKYVVKLQTVTKKNDDGTESEFTKIKQQHLTCCEWIGVLCSSLEPLLDACIEQYDKYFPESGVTTQHWKIIRKYLRNDYIKNGIRSIDYENDLIPNLVKENQDHVDLAQFQIDHYRKILMHLFFLFFVNLPHFIQKYWPKNLQSQYKTETSCKPEINEINWMSVIIYANIWMAMKVEESQILRKIMDKPIGAQMSGLNVWQHMIQFRQLAKYPNHICNQVCA